MCYPLLTASVGKLGGGGGGGKIYILLQAGYHHVHRTLIDISQHTRWDHFPGGEGGRKGGGLRMFSLHEEDREFLTLIIILAKGS